MGAAVSCIRFPTHKYYRSFAENDPVDVEGHVRRNSILVTSILFLQGERRGAFFEV
jgi:hypothetical protein